MKTKAVITKRPNAIILAAGFGIRMIPINTDTPKALVKVGGVPLIERLILQLQEAGIEDITIVVGYLKEQFTYLEEKYSVQLVMNDQYDDKNNLHSLSLVSNRIANSYILPCDIWIRENPFLEVTDFSWYLMNQTNQEGEDTKRPFWNAMTGIAYIAKDFSEEFKQRLGKLASDNHHCKSFWEEALYSENNFLLETKSAESFQIHQINTFEDLRAIDRESIHLQSEAIDIICQTFGVDSDDISDITALKKGMTNRSFLFSCLGKKYIMRIPGEGTDLLINRQEEAAVYRVLAGKGISDHVLYMNPDNGYKITEFLDGARTCDAENRHDLLVCMNKLRYFHSLRLSVNHEFDLFGQLNFYENLRQGQASKYSSYDEVKNAVFDLKDFIDSQVKHKVLTHIDAIPDNFLIRDETDQEIIFLIDWEYAGMQDPHVDIAMFSIYAYYTREQIDELIEIYFDGQASELIKFKIYAYVAICGLLWSNWCEYKSSIGVEFGDYADKQFSYAQEYSQLVLEFLDEQSLGVGG